MSDSKQPEPSCSGISIHIRPSRGPMEQVVLDLAEIVETHDLLNKRLQAMAKVINAPDSAEAQEYLAERATSQAMEDMREIRSTFAEQSAVRFELKGCGLERSPACIFCPLGGLGL